MDKTIKEIMDANRVHTSRCMTMAKVDTLQALLVEMAREDYQTVAQVKESINGFLTLIHQKSKGEG
tara:strand:+ start:3626 stop:3823 length:198 start_codon:yes stop_codon:yes gene_type:complete